MNHTALNVVGLVICLTATIYSLEWVWGVLFIYFGIYMAWHKEAFLLAPARATENVFIHWTIVSLWMVWGGLTLIGDLWPHTYYALTQEVTFWEK